MMNYTGSLFGKIGNRTFDTGKTSADWDKLEADSRRLNFLLQFLRIYDVGEECVSLGVCVNHEGMEEALTLGKKDKQGRCPLLAGSLNDNIRDVIDRAIEAHGQLQPEQAQEHDEVFYGLDGDEVLETDPMDVVERLFNDNYDKPGEPFDTTADRLEWPVKVLVFRRKRVSESERQAMANRTLERVIESLDDGLSDPNGDVTEPTAPMQLAARRFVDEVVRQYEVWGCEPTGEAVEVTREQAREALE